MKVQAMLLSSLAQVQNSLAVKGLDINMAILQSPETTKGKQLGTITIFMYHTIIPLCLCTLKGKVLNICK
jgi:hypothetical protein